MSNVNVAFVTNKRFWNYTYIAIYSLSMFAKPSRNYIIYIISEDYESKHKTQLRLIEEKHNNITFIHVDPKPLVGGYDFYVLGHFSKETYYRLVMQDLLPKIDKVLYLDSDIIVNCDISELFDIDITDYLVGACLDPDTAGLYNGYMPDKKEYMDTVLKLKDPYTYFQAGVLLMNLIEFRKKYTVKDILDYATSEKFQLLDQDILNHLCEDNVKYVDMSWNVMVDFAGIRRSQIIQKAPKHHIDLYDRARKNQKIIHYAGPEKPWHYPDMDCGEFFWNIAKKTVVYEVVLWNMAQHAADEVDRWKHRPPISTFEKIRLLSLKVLPENNLVRKTVREYVKRKYIHKNSGVQARGDDWVPDIPEIYR